MSRRPARGRAGRGGGRRPRPPAAGRHAAVAQPPAVLAHAAPSPRGHGARRRRPRRQRHDHAQAPTWAPTSTRSRTSPTTGRLYGGVDAAAAGIGGRYVELGRAHDRPDAAPRRAARRGRPPAASSAARAATRSPSTTSRPTAKRQDVEVGAGDVVLIRSGWGQQFAEGGALRRRPDRGARHRRGRAPGGWPTARCTPPVPTPSPSSVWRRAAATRCSRPTGCCWSSSGIYIIEALDLEGLAARRVRRVHLRAGAAQHLRRHRLAGAPAGRPVRRGGRPVSELTLAQQLGAFAAATSFDGPPRRGRGQRPQAGAGHARHRRGRRPAGDQPRGPGLGARPGRAGRLRPRSASTEPAAGAARPPSSTACSPTRSTTTTPTCPRCCTPAPPWCRPPWPPPSASAPTVRQLVRGDRASGWRPASGSGWPATTRSPELGVLRARPARDLDLRRHGRRGRRRRARRR